MLLALFTVGARTADVQASATEKQNEQPAVTFALEYCFSRVGMERPTYYVEGFDPTGPVSIYYTTVANYEAAKVKAKAEGNDPRAYADIGGPVIVKNGG